MFTIRGAHDRLARYWGTTNLERAQAVQVGRTPPALAGTERGITVVVLNLDKPELIGPLVRTLAEAETALAQDGLALQLIVGDTGSTDPETLRIYRDSPAFCEVVDAAPYQFSRSNNKAAAGRIACDRLILLNNDVVLPSAQPLRAMSEVLDEEPAVGVVGLFLDFPDGSAQHIGVDFFRSGELRGFPYHPYGRSSPGHRPGAIWPAISVTGAALMVRSALWQAAGGLDEAFEREAQDIDFCLRIQRLGHQVRMVDAGPVTHIENATRAKGEESWEDRRLFMRRWQSFVEAKYL